jgi:hypothetical protein
MQITQVHRSEQEKVFISVQNNEGAVLAAGEVVEFSQTTTAADQGRLVELVDAAVNLTTGIGAKLAGVVETAINTGEVGRVQVYGPANVRASASIAAGEMVVASSINATNIGHVTAATESTLTGPKYRDAVVGWTLEAGPNATNSTVFVSLL